MPHWRRQIRRQAEIAAKSDRLPALNLDVVPCAYRRPAM